MTMKKIVGFFAMALALVACSQMNEIQMQPEGNEIKDGIVINAVLAPKDAVTKAVAEDGNKIVVSWAVNEHIAIVYEPTVGNYQVADATITSVDGSGAAHITFTVASGTPDDAPCSIVYPYSAAQAANPAVKDVATLIGAQKGTLNANLDVRVGKGLIKTATPSLNVTTQPLPQFAIFKFSVFNLASGYGINMTSFTITLDSKDYVITPASPTNEVYAALPPATNEDITFTAVESGPKTYSRSRTQVSFDAGNFYQSSIKLYKAGDEKSVSFDTEYDVYTYLKDGIQMVGTEAQTVGLRISEGDKITISSTGGQIITRIEFQSGWDPGMKYADLTNSTAGTVYWVNNEEYGSIEGINSPSFVLSNSGYECHVFIKHIVVYYLPAPSSESFNTSFGSKTTYDGGTHFTITGTAAYNYGTDIDPHWGLRIDNHLSANNSITITSKNGERIARVDFHCPSGAALATDTHSAPGTVVWKYNEANGAINGINATSVTITNSSDYMVVLDHFDVYYYTE